MSKPFISVKDFAEQNGLLKQTVFKVLKRLEIEPSKSRGSNQNRGQTISYITEDDAQRVLETLASTRADQHGSEDQATLLTEAALYDIGIFYLLSLEPDHDPCRLKVGFASNLDERLRQLRCSAPTRKSSRHGRVADFGRKLQSSASQKGVSVFTPRFSVRRPLAQ